MMRFAYEDSMARRGQIPNRRVLVGDVVTLHGSFETQRPTKTGVETVSGAPDERGHVVEVQARCVHVSMPCTVELNGRTAVEPRRLIVTQELSPPFTLLLDAADSRLGPSRARSAQAVAAELQGPFRFTAPGLTLRDLQYVLTLGVEAIWLPASVNGPDQPETPAGGEVLAIQLGWGNSKPEDGWLIVEPPQAQLPRGVVIKKPDGAIAVEFEEGLAFPKKYDRVAFGFQALEAAPQNSWATWQFPIDPTHRVEVPFDRAGLEGRKLGPSAQP